MNNKTALLIMHVQNMMVADYGGAEIIQPLQQALVAARRNGVRVIYVRVAFTDGYPEVNPHNKLIVAIKEKVGVTLVDDPKMQIHEGVRPLEGEPVIVNYRISAFAGSSLELVLRSLDIDTLVLTGISTGGVVLSTLLEASDKDYVLTVLSDASAELDADLQHTLMEKVFPSKAKVQTTDDWISSLS
ncbi:cysteine hydrolase family protein [Sphingomonas endolithica]|uniref:cysteine hydrolase family protein n=1 Tax=Sphingomonas endolithica TaxID=2972485 RepID=UPI0021AE7FC4|nr:isochorismatase family cysteine hydrolase [Sphingomonas sp. ZFBP2030]